MDNRECKLQMNELYFSKYDFIRASKIIDSDYDSSFKVTYAVNSKDSSKFRITVLTSVKNKSETVHINLETVGIFTIDNNSLSEDVSEQLIKVNTVAIIFPFIRSQLSLLTTQPGLSPILLPPININALLDEPSDFESQ